MKAKAYYLAIACGIIVSGLLLAFSVIPPLVFSGIAAVLTVAIYLPMVYLPVGRKLELYRE